MTTKIKIKLNQRMIQLSSADLLGSGGEANVYGYQDSAIKVFHDLDTLIQMNPGVAMQSLLDRQTEKEKKLKSLPAGLPANVIAPASFVYYRSGTFAGYAMPRVETGYDIRLLTKRSFRDGVVSNATIAKLFVALQQTLDALHQQNVIVGDLNDNNVLFNGDEIFIIDTDSMQFAQYVCPVATEQYLDPRLYGVDLSRRQAFSTQTDYYAAAAMLFRCWLYVGPYGGRHPSLRTWLRRGEQRVSVLSDQVSYPNAATPPEILPDDILDYFYQTFEKDLRQALPVNLLRSLNWRRCRHCGLEFARAICPCQSIIGQVIETSVLYNDVRLTTIFKTVGRIHAIQQQGDQLFYAYEINNTIYRENAKRVCHGPLSLGMRLVIAGKDTWIANKDQALKLVDGQVVERRQTTAWMNEAVLESLGNEIVTIDAAGKLRLGQCTIGQVMAGQTCLACGEEFGFGYYRAGSLLVYFIFDPGSAHIRELCLPTLPGVLREIHCHFSHSHVFCIRSYSSNGRAYRQGIVLARKDGTIEAIEEYDAQHQQNERLLASPAGKLLNASMIASVSYDGLALFQIQASKLLEIKRFQDVARHVPEHAALYHGPHGSIYLASEREILRMDLLSNSP